MVEKANIDIEARLGGDKAAVAAALNLLETRRPESLEQARALLEVLSSKAKPRRHVIGITGPPGAGKSSLISHIIPEYRSRNKSVGIISVDPSSRKSGGALLGDRVRIAYDATDPGVFIRSMAAGSHLGGLAWQTRHCLTVFEAVFDIILVETVGVGQSETEIDQVVDTIVFVVQPGSGDVLQYLKAGIMEIPHVLLINKGDQKNLAMRAYNDLKTAGTLNPTGESDWNLEIIMASALEGWGQEELVATMEKHGDFLLENNIEAIRKHNRCQWVYVLFRERFGSWGIETLGGEASVFDLISKTDITNPFRSMDALAEKLHDTSEGSRMTAP
ncbi:MAG: methylmalonyl Co-A mutase-associated GTPase MeaB [Desulfobacterales bacterium]